jgi:hypothetical protein
MMMMMMMIIMEDECVWRTVWEITRRGGGKKSIEY